MDGAYAILIIVNHLEEGKAPSFLWGVYLNRDLFGF